MSIWNALARLFRAPPGASVAEGPGVSEVIAAGDKLDWPRILRAAGFADPDTWARVIDPAARKWQINTPKRAAAFAATVGHESAGGTRMVENLNYAAKALPQKFGPHRGMTPEIAWQIGRLEDDRGAVMRPADQRAIANLVYGGEWGARNLGNTKPGDGWLYRGRGPTQLTGKGNYMQASIATGLPLVSHPEMAEEPKAGAEIAAWFWAEVKKCNPMADRGDIEAWRRAINGGLNGLADVTARYQRALAVQG